MPGFPLYVSVLSQTRVTMLVWPEPFLQPLPSHLARLTNSLPGNICFPAIGVDTKVTEGATVLSKCYILREPHQTPRSVWGGHGGHGKLEL